MQFEILDWILNQKNTIFLLAVKVIIGTSLVMLPVQGAWVWSLVRELDPSAATNTWYSHISENKYKKK